MLIETWPIDKPIDYPKNARKWSPKAIAKVGASIKAYGWRQPIVVDSAGVIVIGHLRRTAGRSVGLEECPVHVAHDLTPLQIRGLRLADNRTADESAWDADLLAVEFADLKALDFDISLTGFDVAEVNGFIRRLPGEVDEDEVPPVPEAPVTQPGDLWLLGEHQVFCGDVLERDWKYDAILTDPPYGVGVDYGGFIDTPEGVAVLIPRIMAAVARCPAALITSGVPNAWLYPQPAWLCCWIHPAPTGRCPWGFGGVNPVLAYGQDPYLKAGKGSRPDSVVMAAGREGVEGHPTPKPMKVWRWLMERVSPKEREVIFDLFLGSGTSVIAAEELGRICVGGEISPAYCDVIITRWQNLTGKAATLGDGDHKGATFEQVKFGRRLAIQDALKEEALNSQ